MARRISMLSRRWLPFLLCALCACAVRATAAEGFHPAEYAVKNAACKATRRGSGGNEVVDIQLKYVDINLEAPTTILMVHGWPSIWSTWANQIQKFKSEYHLVVPDLRGFGGSTHPGDPQTSGTMVDMVDDLVCLLNDAGVKTAICMGHDWGSSVCYEAAKLRPDIFKAVIGIVVPYFPANGPFIPIDALLPHFPSLSYQLFFDTQTDEAVAELDKDIRRTLRGTFRSVASPPPPAFLRNKETFLGAWNDVDVIDPIPFITPEEEDYLVEQFTIQGFKNTLGFYSTKNRLQTWEHAQWLGNFTLPQPVLAIYPTEDPVGDWILAAKILRSADYIKNLKTETLPGAHWVHMENPTQTNQIISTWLKKQRFDSDDIHDEL